MPNVIPLSYHEQPFLRVGEDMWNYTESSQNTASHSFPSPETICLHLPLLHFLAFPLRDRKKITGVGWKEGREAEKNKVHTLFPKQTGDIGNGILNVRELYYIAK